LSGSATLTVSATVGTIELNNASTSAPVTIGGSALSLADSGLIVNDKISNGAFNNTISAPLNLLGSGTLESNNNSFGGNQSLGN
jgi:hypothetical protein